MANIISTLFLSGCVDAGENRCADIWLCLHNTCGTPVLLWQSSIRYICHAPLTAGITQVALAGCHISMGPLPYGWRTPQGFPQSSGEREQVSLSLTGSRHTRFYRSGIQSLHGSLGSLGSSWRCIFWCCFVSVCSCATVYSVFKIHRRTIGSPFK